MPFIKFMVRNPLDIERLLRIIDDDNLDAKGKANYDELDEEDVVLVIEKGDDPNLPLSRPVPHCHWRVMRISLTQQQDLRELLADGPIVKGSNPISAMERITNDVNEGDSRRGTWV